MDNCGRQVCCRHQSKAFPTHNWELLNQVAEAQISGIQKGNRQTIIIRHKETGHSYHTTKNKRNTTEKVSLKKYNPMLRQHVDYVEVK